MVKNVNVAALVEREDMAKQNDDLKADLAAEGSDLFDNPGVSLPFIALPAVEVS